VGKSTLINLLVGKLQPIVGTVSRNGSARVALFAQHHVDGLDLRRSSVDMMMSIFPGHNAQVFRRHLGCFGIIGDLALQPIKTLSGGQKSKVAFSIVTWKKPHVIILGQTPRSNHTHKHGDRVQLSQVCSGLSLCPLHCLTLPCLYRVCVCT